ncbi:MAG: hypothetical protein JWS11_3551 [Cypionkella sp.]|nr:hypothetical protein [Cypionkella sp.]
MRLRLCAPCSGDASAFLVEFARRKMRRLSGFQVAARPVAAQIAVKTGGLRCARARDGLRQRKPDTSLNGMESLCPCAPLA